MAKAESGFFEIFRKAAENSLDKRFEIRKKANLLYELFLDKELKYSPIDPNNPKRGYSAFQTDLCVFENINGLLLPRVVIEFKTKVSSHDIITYSGKAGKHKAIYPSLRYGILASEIDKIPNRFFIHNEHIDFFIAALNYKDKNLSDFAGELISKEITVSRKLDKINFEDQKFDYYRSDIILDIFMKK